MVDIINRVSQVPPTAVLFLESVRRVIKRWYFGGPITPAEAVVQSEDDAKRLNQSLICFSLLDLVGRERFEKSSIPGGPHLR